MVYFATVLRGSAVHGHVVEELHLQRRVLHAPPRTTQFSDYEAMPSPEPVSNSPDFVFERWLIAEHREGVPLF
jgi:hypothetical protein